MDIALLQMTQRAPQPVKQSTQTNSSSESFDKVFSEAVQTPVTQTESKVSNEQTQVAEVVKEVKDVVEAGSLEEALNVLDIEHDDALLFVVIEGEMLPIDETMNVEDLAAMLNMNAEELQQIIAQLTGEQLETTDVWQVLEQAPQLLAQIAAVLQGESQMVTPKEAGQLAKFIQLAQLVGQKTDTVYQQEVMLGDAKQALQQFATQLSTAQVEQQPKTDFVQLVQQALTSTANNSSTQASQPAQTTESTDQVQASVLQPTSQQAVKTVTVVLPTERSAQSEALMKELQNQLNRAQIANNNGVIKMTLRLFPENLGQIRIEVMQQDGVMQARILATTSAGKELLDSNLNQLKTSLVAQNIQLDRIDIAQALQSSDAGRDQGFFNQFFKQQQEEVEEQKTEDEEDEVPFEELLEEQLQTEEV